MDAYQFYRVAKEPPLARVILNRPDKKNAMNPPAWEETIPIFRDLDQDPEIRVVVLAAEGDCFSVGIDLVEMSGAIAEITDKNQTGGVKWRLLDKIGRLQQAMTCIEQCRKPVIAAIQGYCLGAGLDMVTACDIRLCSRDAVFAVKEAAVGFVADVGVLQRLPLIVGQGFAREMAYTAGDVGARRAREMLLVNEVLDDREALAQRAETLAREIAANAPLAVQASKSVLNYGIGRTIDEGLQYNASLSANIIPSEDLFEAFTAFMEKRPPRFKGR
ncbi:MAG: crotonase/enoyl-CoA hydratase family protein [Desulfobacterales bacterium]|nr:crotonase/enoyl-CoA hydratase family protein [Desulfobacterales bacterium]MDJ0874698.1 crotonase/enoyl-CoA hydratase family protein [Desulfobacterales bacterium]MDJ0883373.1 crotonase/enoyl-CoA hydratase family protein [Desulfobacterales bacterium]